MEESVCTLRSPTDENASEICQCDECVLLASNGFASGDAASSNSTTKLRRVSSWIKIRRLIKWSPFVQIYQMKEYPWVQLAGHQGNFQSAENGKILKKTSKHEPIAYEFIFNKNKSDCIKKFLPEYYGITTANDDNSTEYIILEDLLKNFTSPTSVMDCKIGIRTYLEDELEKASSDNHRQDLYQKMIKVDPNAPTSEEKKAGAISKVRYMTWRENTSSSSQLGFRIEGIKYTNGESCTDFKKVKTVDDIRPHFRKFAPTCEVRRRILDRLRNMREVLPTSDFFAKHEIIGASFLFIVDSKLKANVWIIDLGKTVRLPKDLSVTHQRVWERGNHEDGFLIGLDNIIAIWESIDRG